MLNKSLLAGTVRVAAASSVVWGLAMVVVLLNTERVVYSGTDINEQMDAAVTALLAEEMNETLLVARIVRFVAGAVAVCTILSSLILWGTQKSEAAPNLQNVASSKVKSSTSTIPNVASAEPVADSSIAEKQAIANWVSMLFHLHGLGPEESLHILNIYRRRELVELDRTTSRFRVKDPRCLERSTITRAQSIQ